MKKPIIITSLAVLIGAGFGPTANALANESDSSIVSGTEINNFDEVIIIDGVTFDLNGDYDSYILEEKPAPVLPQITGSVVSESKINSFDEVVIIEGVAYDYNGNRIVSDSQFTTFGKLSWAAKAIRAGYNSLPKSVKNKIGSQAKFLAAVAVLDHFTGTVEDGLTQGFKNAGFSNTTARFLAKTVTFFTL